MDFKTNEAGEKFFFNPEKPKDGSINVRAIPIGELDKIQKGDDKTPGTRKTIVEHRPYYKRGPVQRLEHTVIDTDAEAEAVWDYELVSWENVTLDGKPLDCTKANKIKMLCGNPDFFAFFVKCKEKIDSANAERFGGVDSQGN